MAAGPHQIHTRSWIDPGARVEGAASAQLPVVLLHGLVISSVYMIPTARLLASRFPTYAPDMPGFGQSSKPREALNIGALAEAMLLWLDALRLERVHLLGNSLGCQVIAEIAIRAPERVGRIVLVAPSVDCYARTVTHQLLRGLVDWTRERPSLTLAHANALRQAGLRRAWRTFRFGLAHPVEDLLPFIAAPALVVRGGRDPIVSQRWAETVTRLLPDGRLIVVPGAPHAVNHSAPGSLADVVEPFLLE